MPRAVVSVMMNTFATLSWPQKQHFLTTDQHKTKRCRHCEKRHCETTCSQASLASHAVPSQPVKLPKEASYTCKRGLSVIKLKPRKPQATFVVANFFSALAYSLATGDGTTSTFSMRVS
mmetsp:Transcript_115306/g.229789  ORF Transcript_115306/g.229789 Transcript_115306/m.229789 type:complete len:119 (-) Transcript_115306:678-1034(-)